jgi:hypothetical protein
MLHPELVYPVTSPRSQHGDVAVEIAIDLEMAQQILSVRLKAAVKVMDWDSGDDPCGPVVNSGKQNF